jgi:hypothetical protein
MLQSVLHDVATLSLPTRVSVRCNSGQMCDVARMSQFVSSRQSLPCEIRQDASTNTNNHNNSLHGPTRRIQSIRSCCRMTGLATWALGRLGLALRALFAPQMTSRPWAQYVLGPQALECGMGTLPITTSRAKHWWIQRDLKVMVQLRLYFSLHHHASNTLCGS